MKNAIVLLLVCLLWPAGYSPAGAERKPPRLEDCFIVNLPDATPLEILAAHEVRRYAYLRTGRLLPLRPTLAVGQVQAGCILAARKDRVLASPLSADPQLKSELRLLAPQQYLLKTIRQDGRWRLVLAGGDDVGTLYAAYRFAEHLGARFYLHGDVVPESYLASRIAFPGLSKGADLLTRLVSGSFGPTLPDLAEQAKPLFDLRGIQPFHDFPEGPDWWNREDYLAILAQLPKLRMNFFGLHTYPEGGPNAEPTVWIGLTEDLAENGAVKFSYPASYQNTLRGNWGYKARKTGDFAFGASQLFERDDFGAEVMSDLCPQPATPDTANELFQRTGALLRESFQQARALGIKICVGTESPLTIPKKLQDHLKSLNLNPTNSATVQKLYEGIFKRIAATYPLDYFWFWTPEHWTWEGARPDQIKATTNDLMTALSAAKAVQAPFQLATCGWVLGPVNDRSLFDKFLPKDWPLSCINREVGKSPVEPGFAKVSGRPKWAIPWLEDDPALTSPQLWVGRMRQDAVDALDYGCTGLMGIHWRTRVLGPNVSALAQAAWEQSPWRKAPARVSGWIGGQAASFPTNRIENTTDAPLYQTVRYNMSSYRLVVPNGVYTVTLKFCEPHFNAVGKRIFGVKLQDKIVLDRFDIFAQAGKNKALDFTYDQIAVTDGWINIEFIRQVENPAIAAIAVEGAGFSQKINCGGPAYRDYSADLPPMPRFQPTEDFYLDWARCQFGPIRAKPAARIFAQLDGKLPRPSDWIDGPGGIKPDTRPWDKVRADYAYAAEFSALRPLVIGAGNLERFDYWRHTFLYMEAMARLNCAWGEFNQALDKVKAEKVLALKQKLAQESVLPLRKKVIQCLQAVYDHLLATITTPGELGTIANWEQHIQSKLIGEPGEALAKLLGASLPADAQVTKGYRGPLRVIVPATRTSLKAGEGLSLKVLILSATPDRASSFYWRPLGQRHFTRKPLKHCGRGVYSVELPATEIKNADFEYYLEITPSRGAPVIFPATAPRINQTVVIQLAER